MLVFTRKLGESFVISDSITVKILHLGGGKVRIGVEAPPQIKILREEIQTHSSEWHPGPSVIAPRK
jgi:carbon storage regulator